MPPQKNVHARTIELAMCTDKKLGVRFLCRGDWTIQTEDNAILVIISEDPSVTFTIAKSDSSVLYLEQLTDRALQAMGQYADGFKRERTHLGKIEAIKVEGTSRVYPQIRLLDYYVIHDNRLYGLLFSVNPKERWQDFESLIEAVSQSIELVKREYG